MAVTRRKTSFVILLLATWVMVAGGSHAGEAQSAKLQTKVEKGVVVRSAAVKASASFGAETLITANIGQSVDLGIRDGGWQQITRLAGKAVDGWIRTYQVRTDIAPDEVVVERSAGQNEGPSGLAALSRRTASLFGRREMSGSSDQMTAAMGVRGLTEADLENAKPNAEELEKFKQYGVKKSSAKKFAKQAGLRSVKVAALPEPEKAKKNKKERKEKRKQKEKDKKKDTD